jgi:hypothetical protein
MTPNQYEGRVERLNQVNDVISKLDPAIRVEAFALLKPSILGGATESHHADSGAGSDPTGPAELFGKHTDAKPAENAVLAAAYLFRKYGAVPFKASEVNDVAADVGVTVPDRCDKTLQMAARAGKSLFRALGSGTFKVTSNGAMYFKSEFGITPGKTPRPSKPAE